MLALLGVAAITLLTIRRTMAPLGVLADRAEHVARGELDFEMPSTSRHDEVGRLTQSFDQMRHELALHLQNLARVAREKQRLASELEIAHQIQIGLLPSEHYLDAVCAPLRTARGPASGTGGRRRSLQLLHARPGALLRDGWRRLRQGHPCRLVHGTDHHPGQGAGASRTQTPQNLAAAAQSRTLPWQRQLHVRHPAMRFARHEQRQPGAGQRRSRATDPVRPRRAATAGFHHGRRARSLRRLRLSGISPAPASRPDPADVYRRHHRSQRPPAADVRHRTHRGMSRAGSVLGAHRGLHRTIAG